MDSSNTIEDIILSEDVPHMGKKGDKIPMQLHPINPNQKQSKNPIPKGMKIVYLKDQLPSTRVLTILYMIHEDTNSIYYNYTMNKVVDPDSIKLDDRLRSIIGNELFKELQKRFKKRFGGDQHNRKQARTVVLGKYMKDAHSVFMRKTSHPLILILTDIFSREKNLTIKLIADYHLEEFIDNETL